MLHNEARNLLVKAYEKTHDAKGITMAYGISVPAVYRLTEIVEKLNLPVSARTEVSGLSPLLSTGAGKYDHPY